MSTAQRRLARRPRMLAFAATAVAAIVIAAVALFAFGGGDHEPSGTSTSPTGFVLPKLNGPGVIRLADYRGKPVVVNFFASWCSECDFELPGFAKVAADLDGKVVFIGVDSLETGDPNTMPTRHHITDWPLATDVGGPNSSGLHDALGGGSFMPITAFYDANGHLLTVNRGALPEDALRTDIGRLFGIRAGP